MTRDLILRALQMKVNEMSKTMLITTFTIGLFACASQSSRETLPPCPEMIVETDSGEINFIEGIELWLPSGSTLIEENNIDAKHWTWSSDFGMVSISWVGRIGRNLFFESHDEIYCVAQNSNHGFRLWHRDGKTMAVSEPLLESGAGLLVEIEPAGNYREATALTIIRSIKRAAR